MLKLDFKQQLGALGLAVSVEVPANGITAVFGLSGAGKTSLINAVSGLTKPDSGVITLNDRPLVDCSKGLYLPLKSAVSATFFRKHGCFLTTAFGAIFSTA